MTKTLDISDTVTTYSFLSSGGQMGALTQSFDWSATSIGPVAAWPLSLRTTLSTVLRSKLPMGLLWGDELLLFYNDAYRASLGEDGRHPAIFGIPAAKAWQEIWPLVSPQIEAVLKNGEGTWNEDLSLPIYRNGTYEEAYWTFGYTPVLTEDDRVGGVLVTGMETTSRVKAEGMNIVELFQEAPIAIATISADEGLHFLSANRYYGYLIGRSPAEIIGKPLLTALPELEGQGFDALLKKVIATGTPYLAYEVPVQLARQQGLETVFINFSYTARKTAGKVKEILVTANDVTHQVKLRQAVEEKETQLRSLIKAAPFPMAVYIGEELRIQQANPAIIQVYGKGPDVVGRNYFDVLPELADHGIADQLREVYATGIPFNSEISRVDINVAGTVRTSYFKYSFTPLLDRSGEVYGILNTGVDVTAVELARQRAEAAEFELVAAKRDLERQVRERTAELGRANAALKAANAELEQKNAALMLSNDELSQYAYVTSHDLQEPLRKIRFFVSKLYQTVDITPEADAVLAKIMHSSGRMTQLIQDLLSFSRLLGTDEIIQPVDLGRIIHDVLGDFELSIEEKSARVEVHPMPAMSGISLQLNQLFYNLIGNALKFSSLERPPEIRITARLLSAGEASAILPQVTHASHHEIVVADNGVGFEPEYSEYIFELFRKLHSKDRYSGSGIGLALCKRIVKNHGGHIYATSVPGEGSAFHILLPADGAARAAEAQ